MAAGYRTDMADEARSLWNRSAGANTELPGVIAREENLGGLAVTAVEITDEEGAHALGKAPGKYFSLDLPVHFDRGAEEFASAVGTLAALISRCIPEGADSVLVAALGNPDITPDALGSLAAGSILVTRHLKKSGHPGFEGFFSLALCRPGVLGTSGIETASQVSVLCRELEPSFVIAVDALAGTDADRLGRAVQVSDAGISPGSGVGNDRQELSKNSLGVPAVSIGIPTVIDAGLFGGDALSGMFVTPRSIDSLVRSGARVIGYAVNMAVHHLSIADIDALVG